MSKVKCGTCGSFRKLFELLRAEVQQMSPEQKAEFREAVLESFKKQRESFESLRSFEQIESANGKVVN